MAKVRIRKAGPGETPGYYNKTSLFLKKAQAGMQVNEDQTTGEEALQAYYQYAYTQLSKEAAPDKVYTALVTNGLPENIAYQMITQLMDKLVEEGVINPDYKREKEQVPQEQEQAQPEAEVPQQEMQEEDASMFEEQQDMDEYEESYIQDDSHLQDSYMQDGGYIKDEVIGQYGELSKEPEEPFNLNELISNTPGIQPGLDFPSLAEYIPEYLGVEWEPLDYLSSENQMAHGGPIKKKDFVKNVMSLLKKEEGGEEETESSRSTPMDTLTEDVKKHKYNFLNAVKEKATKVKAEEMYDKLMQSNDPEMQQLGMQEQYQFGGYTGGDNALYRFVGGGEDPGFYEADFLPEAAYGYSTGNLRRAQEGDAGKKYKVITLMSNPPVYQVVDENGKEVFSSRNLGEAAAFVGEDIGEQNITNQGIPKARINYVPNYTTGPGAWYRNLLPWNPLLQRMQYARQMGMPYNYGTNTPYMDPLAGMKPIARQVTKRGILGRPKTWTDIYSPGYSTNTSENIFANDGTLFFPGQEITQRVNTPASKSSLTNKEIQRGETQHGRQRPVGTSRKYEREWEDPNPVSEAQARANTEREKQERNAKINQIQRLLNPVLNSPVIGIPDTDVFEQLKQNPSGLPSYMPKAQSGITINNPNLPQPAPANPDLTVANQAGLLGTVTQGPNTWMGNQQYFSQPAPVDPNVQAYNNSLMTTEPLGDDLSQCTPEQKRDTTSKCYCSPKARKNPSDKRCYEGGLVGVNYRRDTTSTVDPEGMVNVFNAGVRGVTGLLNRKDARRREQQMYDNLTSDNLYAAQSTRNRGDWVDVGSQLGQYRFDQMGQDRSGFSSYGKYGGYMQDGGELDYLQSASFPEDSTGYQEGDEVYMTDDEIKRFMANGGQVEYL